MATTASNAAQQSVLASLGVGPGGRRGAGQPAPAYDPVQACVEQVVANPHVLLLGQPGTGKSTLAKSLAARLLGSTADGPRHLGVVDNRGEYGPLAEALGLTSLPLYPGGPDRLNPLDAGPDSPGFDHEDVVERRRDVVAALCAMKLRRPLTAVEHLVLEAAVNELAVSCTGPQPVLGDVARLLATPTHEMTEWAATAPLFESAGIGGPIDVAEDGRCVRHALEELLGRELRGVFDAASTVPADGAGPGVVIDLSLFYPRRAVHALHAVAACAWLEAAAIHAEEPGDFPRRYNIVDDAYVLMRDEHACRYLASFLGRCTSHGVANLVIGHRLDDLRWAAGNNRTLTAAAGAFVEPVGTRVVFRHPGFQMELTAKALGLATDEAGVVPHLSTGLALWKVGGGTGFFVRHELGPDEWALCDDNAMTV